MTKTPKHESSKKLEDQLNDPSVDPLTPATSHLLGPNDSLYYDVVETVRNHEASMSPEVSTAVLRPEDRLHIDFDTGDSVNYWVERVTVNSLAFGSDDVRSPRLGCVDDEGAPVTLVGSSISSRGTMMTPGAIKDGQHIVGSTGVSSGTVKYFSVERKDPSSGEYRDVSPNVLAKKAEGSESYSDAQARFLSLTEQLEAKGFDFDAEDDMGYSRFLERSDDGFIYAARQGFGCAVVPQYEIYTYDADSGILTAMRSIPGEGVFQTAIMPISPADLAKTGFNKESWQGLTSLSPGDLYRGTDAAPMFTYTWQAPDQVAPTTTVITNAHGLDERVKRVENGESLDYIPAEVNITTDGASVHAEAANPVWWADVDSYASVLGTKTQVEVTDGYVNCTIGDSPRMVIPVQPAEAMNYMAEVFNGVINNRTRKFGSEVVEQSNPTKRRLFKRK